MDGGLIGRLKTALSHDGVRWQLPLASDLVSPLPELRATQKHLESERGEH